jgi:hypothetical protein
MFTPLNRTEGFSFDVLANALPPPRSRVPFAVNSSGRMITTVILTAVCQEHAEAATPSELVPDEVGQQRCQHG